MLVHKAKHLEAPLLTANTVKCTEVYHTRETSSCSGNPLRRMEAGRALMCLLFLCSSLTIHLRQEDVVGGPLVRTNRPVLVFLNKPILSLGIEAP